MALSWLRKAVNRFTKTITRGRGRTRRSLPLWVEMFEDRVLLSTFQWTGLGTGATATNWDNPANWTLITGTGTFPSVAGDVAQFTGTYATPQTATVDATGLTVGEIDFGTTQNITINSTGGNKLTLDNTGTAANAILTTTNTGTVLISAPVQVAAATPLTATLSGGILQLTNTSTGATSNLISPTGLTAGQFNFTVNPGATLEESAVGTGSLATANLVDTGALNNATLNLAGGTLAIDPTASTAANGLSSKYIAQTTNLINANDFLTTAAIAGSPTVQTSAGAAASGLANTFSFGTNNIGASQSFGANVPAINFGVQWTGMIDIATPGPTTFNADSDDAFKLYVDNMLVIDNDGGHGPNSQASGTVNLTSGFHDIRILYTNGGGGAEALLTYAPAGGTAQPVPFSVLYSPDPLNLGNAVTLSASSTIQLNGSNFTSVGLGALSFTGGTETLTVNGQSGKKLNFSGATQTAGGTFTLSDTPDVGFISSYTAPAPYTPGFVNLQTDTLVKQGSGQLFLDNTTTASPNVFTGSTIDIQNGRVVAVGSSTAASNSDPLGSVPVTIDGGTLSLDTRNGAFTFSSPVTVNTSGAIEDQAVGQTLTLSGPVTFTGATPTLTFNTFGGTLAANGNIAGAILQVNGVISGGGNLVENNVPFGTTNKPGQLTLNATNLYAGTLTVNSGTVVDQAANGLAAGSTAVVNNGGTLTINGAAGTATNVISFTVNAGGTLLVDDTTTNLNNRFGTATPGGPIINLDGGTFTFNGTNTASTATSDNFGAINVQSAFSTVNLNKGTGGNLTLAADSLNQTGTGAGVNFTGTGLGATAATNVLTITNIPTVTDVIIPYATVAGADFASYNQTGQTGLGALPAALYYTGSLAVAPATANVKLTANDVVLAAGQTINSLVISGTGLTLTGTGTDVLNTGSVLVTGGTDSINAPVNIGTAGTVIVNAGAVAQFNGPISGSALYVEGGGATLLNNANTYTGGTTLESGTLSIGNPTGLGSGGTLTLVNGTVQASIATTVSNPVSLTNAGSTTGTVTLGGSTPLNFSGSVTVSGANTLTLSNPAGTTFSAPLAGSGSLTLAAGAANGTLTLSGNNSTFLGTLTVQGGTVVAGSATALSSATTTLSGGTLLGTAGLNLSSPLTINGPVTLGGPNFTLSGALTTTLGADLTVNNTTTLAAAVTGPLDLAAGSGTLVLGTGTTISGDTTVAGGTLSLASTSVLGPTTNNLWLGGGTLLPTAPLTFVRPLQLSGTPTLGGTNPNAPTFSGPVTLQSSTTLGVTNAATISGVIGGSLPSGLILAGPGTLSLTGTNTYTGATTLSGGTLVVGGAAGALAGTSAITLNQGATLTLNDTTAPSTNRVNPAAPVSLNGGTLNFLGNGSGTSTETLGAVNLSGGRSIIASTLGSGQSAKLTFASLTRPNGSGASVRFSGTGLGGASNQILFTSAPTLTGGILPYATVNGTEFATYVGGATPTGIQAYSAAGLTYAPTVSGSASTTDNVKLATSDTVTTTKTINSLTLSGDQTLTINPGVILTITSGAVLITGTTTGAIITGGGTLVLGEGIIDTSAGSISTINTTVTGTNLTLAGTGAVTLGGTTTFTGGNAIQTITFTGVPTGGTFTLSFNGSATAAITYSTTVATLQANILAALVALPGIASANNIAIGGTATAVTVTFQGALGGAAQNTMLATNALTGGTTPTVSIATTTPGVFATSLSGPTLTLGSATALSAGGLQVNSGTLQTSVAGGVLLNSAVALNNASLTLGGTNPLLFSRLPTSP